MLVQKCKYGISILLILLLCDVTLQNEIPVAPNYSSNILSNISGQNWTFWSNTTCGFFNRNLYFGNGTQESVLFFSNQPFSIAVEEENTFLSFTGSFFSKEISNQQEAEIRKKQTSYEIQKKKLIVQRNKKQSGEKKTRQFANLSIYGVCKSNEFSTNFKEIEVKITFFPERESHVARNVLSKAIKYIQNSQYQFGSENHIKVNIGAFLYCIDRKSINQVNFVVNKLYELLIISIIGLAISFQVRVEMHWCFRVILLIYFFFSLSLLQNRFAGLIMSGSCVMFLGIIYFPFLQSDHSPQERKYIFNNVYFVVSSLCIFFLAYLKSYQSGNIQHEIIILQIINFIILCNSLFFTQNCIYIRRFRHAFCYFIGFMLVEIFLKKQLQSIEQFNLINIQVFSAPPQSNSLFFIIMLIPLCDFFFKSYSSDNIFKFFIILVPVISKPYQISYSASFFIGFILWLLKQAIKGRDLRKIIKHKV